MNQKPSNTAEQCAYERGQQAKKKGAEPKANPHRAGTVGHRWWKIGYEGDAP